MGLEINQHKSRLLRAGTQRIDETCISKTEKASLGFKIVDEFVLCVNYLITAEYLLRKAKFSSKA